MDARYVATSTSVDGLPPPAFPEIAFAGRSNVGKSSLINCVIERKKLVRTSGTPGQTRGISIFRIDIKSPGGERATLDLVDLPGYGYAKRSKGERKSWGPMIEGFLEQREALRGVVLIVDARRGMEDMDAQLHDYLDHIGRPVLVVATKIDKLTKAERTPQLTQIAHRSGHKPIGASAETREGRDEIFACMLDLAGIAR
jgi:GTP-binding protein